VTVVPVDEILSPVRNGSAVTFRPIAWANTAREGFMAVPSGCPLLAVEGVGAEHRELARLVDGVVWVQGDETEIDARSLARVGQPGGPQTVEDRRGWMDVGCRRKS